MTKKKQKKPTLNEVKKVVENLLYDLQIVNNKVDSIGMVFNDYVEYKNEVNEFLKYLKEKKKEQADDKKGTADKDSK